MNSGLSWTGDLGYDHVVLFTREYTKCTAGSTFCFVVVVLVVVVVVLVVLGKPLIKLASILADS
jgi:hypothetical protein